MAISILSALINLISVTHHWNDQEPQHRQAAEKVVDLFTPAEIKPYAFVEDMNSSKEDARLYTFQGSPQSSPDLLDTKALRIDTKEAIQSLPANANAIEKTKRNPYYCSSPDYVELKCNDK